MAFDYKKEFKEFYLPPKKPQLVHIPKMQFVAVRGKGNPNDEEGEYKNALAVQSAMSYTLKMSKMGDHRMEGYFDFVVPPLEGLWRQDGVTGVDVGRKEDFRWISMIRLPDFVTEAEFAWAVREAERKKKEDFSKAEFFRYDEGLCVQCMHFGPFDDEPETVRLMHRFMEEQGFSLDISEHRLHHEIYLSDARKTAPEKRRTVLRHPIRRR